MTDYSKLTVPKLKEELKNRNIPLTKLKVKQDFIDKLLEADATDRKSTSPAAIATTGEESRSVLNVAAEDENGAVVATEEPRQRELDGSVEDRQSIERAQDSENKGETSAAVKYDRRQEEVIAGEGSQALSATESSDPRKEPALLPSVIEKQDNDSRSQAIAATDNATEVSSMRPAEQLASRSGSDHLITPQPPSAQLSVISTPSSGTVPAVELLEDSRKRKRRSVTPAPLTIEIAQKKAKASDGSPRITKQEDFIMEEGPQPLENNDGAMNGQELHEKNTGDPHQLEDRPLSTSQTEPTSPLRKVEADPPSESPGQRASSEQEDDHPSQQRKERQRSPIRSPVRSKPPSPTLLKRQSPSPPKSVVGRDRLVSPAIHPATSSLYIRNFKRPLHIPSLRSHISAVAASPHTDADNAPIASFYLDNIRTHGFMTFTSIAAASRARSALHDSRFPDEKTREPLWVDFIPDERVEEWIEIEQRANGGGRVGRRWEVVYQESSNGMEAILQEAGSGSGARVVPQRKPSGPMTRRDSEVAVAVPSSAPGVHPDRARLVPPEDDVPRRKESSLQQGQRPEQSGTGFRALDDLFLSTRAKPKLYYKPVDPQITEERLDMIKDLRNTAGAKSGDPDMKRYSFELDRRREEWVDKGPEFGFGARGRGFERGGRGGYRGRGGTGRGSDTWRSGGRY